MFAIVEACLLVGLSVYFLAKAVQKIGSIFKR